MGKGSRTPATQTVVNENRPDPITQQWMTQLSGAAQGLYDQGPPAYYPGSTVVPFSQQTQAGLDAVQAQAQMGAPNYGAAQAAANRALTGQNPAIPALAGTAMMAGMNPAMGAAQQAAGRTTTAGVPQLEQYASGQINPYLDSIYSQGASDIQSRIAGQMMQAGRTNSGAHQQVLADSLARFYGDLYAPAFEQAQSRGLEAAGQLSGLQQADLGRQLQAVGLMGDLYGQGIGQQMDAFGQIGDLYSQGNADAFRAMTALPGLYDYGMTPARTMMDVGGMYEDLAGRYLADDLARWNYAAGGGEWDLLNQYAGIVSGMPTFGSSTQTTTQPRQRGNMFMGALSGASAGAGILGSLGSAGVAAGPWAMPLLLGGALLGGVGGRG